VTSQACTTTGRMDDVMPTNSTKIPNNEYVHRVKQLNALRVAYLTNIVRDVGLRHHNIWSS